MSIIPLAARSSAIDRPAPALIARFAQDLAAIWPEGGRLGIAVSGGPDSLALLLLAHAGMPGRIEAATVDHGLRPESAAEAADVSATCAGMGIPHEVLTVTVAAGNLQDAARAARYDALARWAVRKSIGAIATAHHADDQAETMVMRLNRASGLAGLAGVRARGVVPGSDSLPLLRPLLGWRRAELAGIVDDAGIEAVQDPSNTNPRFDRVRIRNALGGQDWLDPLAMAASAQHLADAEEALEWATQREWEEAVRREGASIRYRPTAPRAVRLRVLARALREMGGNPRGSELARLADALDSGEGGTLAGAVARSRNGEWLLEPEGPRRS